MQSTIEHIENLVSKAGDIVETKVEIWKLRAAGKISETVSSLISVIVIAMLAVAAILISSIGIAFWIGSEMGKTGYGFFIVGGFYAFISLLVFLFRTKWIKRPLSNLIIQNICK